MKFEEIKRQKENFEKKIINQINALKEYISGLEFENKGLNTQINALRKQLNLKQEDKKSSYWKNMGYLL